MQTTVNSKALASALSRIAPFVPPKAAIPIVECVLIECDGDQMKLTGSFNTDMQATVTIECDTKKKGATCIAMNRISGFAASVDGNIEIKVAKSVATLTCGTKRRASYGCLDPAEFPKMPEEEMGEPKLLDGFIQAISRIHAFASTEESRRVLCSVICDKDALVCSDGRALAAVPMAIESVAVIPIDFARGLVKSKSESLTVQFSEKLVKVDCGDSVFISKLIDSPPPNWRMMETDAGPSVVFNREEFLSTLSGGARASDSACDIRFGDNKISVSSQSGSDEEYSETGAPNVFSGHFRGKPAYIKAALQGNQDESLVTIGMSANQIQLQITSGDVRYVALRMGPVEGI